MNGRSHRFNAGPAGNAASVLGPSGASSTDNAFAFWDSTTGRLLKDRTGETIAADRPFSLSQTWNNAGVTFTGLKLDITSTASAAASMLLDLQVGGSSALKVLRSGTVIAGDGSVSAPSYALASGTNTGIYYNGGNLAFTRQGNLVGQVGAANLQFASGYGVEFTFGSGPVLLADGIDILAQRRGTNAQTSNHYDTYVSATDYHRLAIKTARATLSGVTGASVTATGLIPDGAVLVGLTSKVTTGLGTGNGTTGYQIGDGSDADRWGAITGTVAGTSSDNTNWTAGTVQAFTSAQDVVVTAVGGNFDGTGVIYLSAQYLIGQCD